MFKKRHKIKNKHNYILPFIFIFIITLTIGYSSSNSDFNISGEAIYRINEDIRITDIKLNENSLAPEEYDPSFTKDTIKIGATVSNNINVIYDVVITNKSNIPYKLKSINKVVDLYNNDNVTFSSNEEMPYLIESESEVVIQITFATNNINERLDGTLQFEFEQPESKLVASSNSSMVFSSTATPISRSSVSSITFMPTTKAPMVLDPTKTSSSDMYKDILGSWDSSVVGNDNSVITYYVKEYDENNVETGYYDVYVGGYGVIYSNENSNGLFSGYTNLKKIIFSNDTGSVSYFDTSYVTNMKNMFNGSSSLVNLDLSFFDTSKVTTMESMFNGCTKLYYANVTSFEYYNVTTMANMFNSCTALAGTEIRNGEYILAFNDITSPKLTEIGGFLKNSSTNATKFEMNNFRAEKLTLFDTFRNYYGTSPGMVNIISVSMKNLYIPNVTNIGYMFYGLSKAEEIDITGIENSKANNMTNMFYNCSSLKNIKGIEDLTTSSVTSMSGMFYGCKLLEDLNLSNFNTVNVTNMKTMFYNCAALVNLDLTSFNTKNVSTMESMFQNCTKLYYANVASFEYDNVTTMKAMFNSCTALAGTEIRNGEYILAFNDITAPKLIEIGSFLSNGATNATKFEMNNFRAEKLTAIDTFRNYYGTSPGLANVTSISIKNLYIPNVTNMGYMLSTISKVEEIDITGIESSKATNMSFMFYNCPSLKNIKGLENLDTLSVTNMQAMFNSCKLLEDLNLSNFNTVNVTDMKTMFKNCSSLVNLDLTSFNTKNVTTMESMFEGCSKLYYANVTSFEYDNVTTIKSMFYSCTSLAGTEIRNGEYILAFNDITAPNLTIIENFLRNSSANAIKFEMDNFSAEKLTTLESWRNFVHIALAFANVTSVSMKNLYIPNVTNISYMFYGLSKVEEIDITGIESSKATNMGLMFYNCSSLKNIKGIEDLDTSSATNMQSMFYECKLLESLNLNNFNTVNVTNMKSMFYNCTALVNLNLTSFNTEKVTTMESMFYNCSSLLDINLTSFNTANVTTMVAMFKSCSKLTSLDLSSFNTAKVTKMNEMVRLCTNLNSLNISNFDFTNADTSFFNYSSGKVTSLNISGIDSTSYSNTKLINIIKDITSSDATVYVKDEACATELSSIKSTLVPSYTSL